MSSGAAQLPVVAIVGRPNVGKSSLFNYLAGRRISIVDPTAGVTRDRVATVVEAEGRYFELVDTGGVGIVDRDDLSADVERQINYALAEAAVVVFVVDVRSGLAPLDWEVAERLRPWSKPVILVANKADTEALAAQVGEFYRLGFGDPLAVSAEQRRGKDELLAAILARLPAEAGSTAPEDVALKLAIVGRRNVGKSTFINSLAQTERVIVSEVPGTTRDSIDVRFQRDGKTFLAIDTAGVRKRSAIADDIEFYSLHRAQRSIRRADVVLHFFDARHRIGRVDKQLADYILQEHKPAIFVINKWDLVKNVLTTERMADYVRRVFPMLEYVPIAFITARNGKNVLRVLQLAQQLHKQAGVRVSTGDLNRVLRQALEAYSPPLRFNRVPKIYYATQVGVHPPTFVLFTNGPELFEESYLRYLSRTLRQHFPFPEVALKLVLRAREGLGGRREEPVAESIDTSASDEEAATIVRWDQTTPEEPRQDSHRPDGPTWPRLRSRKKPETPDTWQL
ncbi:MAG: ribosome biogenesis GTPase Der [Gemmataceae bacterium]|nr:ribosome biogenesis GTPase Der [Gemmataceae bacterium]MDW8244502.1 ribosome biogenesis GTPase Der [Thermogemmata sp.]